jgi:hypothetical protein
MKCSGVKNYDLSPCKSLGVMIVFIIMKEIGVIIGILKPGHFQVFYTKGEIYSFLLQQ